MMLKKNKVAKRKLYNLVIKAREFGSPLSCPFSNILQV